MTSRLALLLFGLVAFSAIYAIPKKDKPTVFALNADTLQARKIQLNNYTTAYAELLKQADEALTWGPHSVMEKKNIPPTGNKHDYMSIAIYFWPDLTKPDGLPYINKDGEVNPEVHDYLDKEYMPEMCDKVYKLALAYYFSNNEKYAAYASKLMQVWFLDTATRMNPNLQFAQAIKGLNDGRGIGLIETRHFTKVVDAIGLLQGSKSWTDTNQKGMRDWFSHFLNWMQTSKNGIEEMNTQNNHGCFYDMQRLSLALFIDSTALAKNIVNNALSRIDKQMADDGSFPLEMKRTISMHYSAFNLEALFQIALMAEKLNLPIWKTVTPSGRSLEKGFAFLKPYLAKEKTWPGQQIKPFDFANAYPLLLIGRTKYNCKDCAAALQKMEGDIIEQLLY